MAYEDNPEMGAALKIINRLLDKVDAHENRQERERIEKMLIDNSKPPVDEFAAWKARWKAEARAQIDNLRSADFETCGKLSVDQRLSLNGFLRSLEASL